MDIELYKMLLTVMYDLLDKLPVGVSGVVVTVIAGYIVHKSKAIPYKIIKQGVNGQTLVDKEALKVHCQVAHEPLIDALKTLTDNQVKIQSKVGEISENVSYIKGQLSERHTR